MRIGTTILVAVAKSCIKERGYQIPGYVVKTMEHGPGSLNVTPPQRRRRIRREKKARKARKETNPSSNPTRRMK